MERLGSVPWGMAEHNAPEVRRVTTKPARSTAPSRARPSQTAPVEVSTSYQAWHDALSDPAFRRDLDEGLEDVAAGRTKPWAEIRRRMP